MRESPVSAPLEGKVLFPELCLDTIALLGLVAFNIFHFYLKFISIYKWNINILIYYTYMCYKMYNSN